MGMDVAEQCLMLSLLPVSFYLVDIEWLKLNYVTQLQRSYELALYHAIIDDVLAEYSWQ